MAKTNREKAYDYYCKNKGKVTFKAIAQKFDVSESTLRRWRKEDDWDDDQPKNKKSTRGSPKKRPQKTVEYELIQSNGLNDRQLLFCMHYVRCWNATKAYQKAYECDYRTAHANAHRMMANDGIKAEITRLKKDIADGLMLSAEAVLQKYIDIAFADMNDFIRFENIESTVTEVEQQFDKEGNLDKEITRTVPYTYTAFYLKPSNEVDGTLISELSKGKDGMFKVKLTEKMAALNMLAKFYDLLGENTRKRLQDELARLNIDKTKAEIMKVRSETKGAGGGNTTGVDLSDLTMEELRAIANSKR
ncbi:terminase small subunit [Lysinibacillus macroides]|uniref:PBSX phage terminase small subunit-like N-terminal domain-containing protein n=1 Tax=Lysinibacillus macroides TaxID=33935 RepID=A0A0M9DIX9_9BACI|nr:terminase small subunit [Lysinibacillus macroides]KOY81563.1 hypothetical protein ADM90_14265 [Lysinibacillus macroides]QPR69595.1 terminase small subunit [Lysinibacillus macroides]